MAGFLAPQINEIGAAPIGASAPPDTSVGDLLSNVGSAFDAFGRESRRGGTATQSDRDDAALRPFFNKLSTIVQMRDSGAMPPNVATIKIRSLLTTTLANFSHLRSTILEGAGFIAGEEFNFTAPDIANEIIVADTKFVLEDQEGRGRLKEAMVWNEDDSLNAKDTQLAISALVGEIKSSRSSAALRKSEIERLREERRFDNEMQAEKIDPILADMAFIAGRGLAGLTESFFASPDRSAVDAAEILIGLRQTKAEYEQIFNEKAGEEGVLDEERFRAGLAQTLKPFDNMIEAFIQIASNPQLLNQIGEAKDRIELRKFANSVGSPLTQEFERLLALRFLANATGEIEVKLKDFSTRLKRTAVGEKVGEDIVDETGSLTPEARGVVDRFTDTELKKDIRTSLDAWDTIGSVSDKDLEDDDARRFFVTKFSIASDIINTTGVTIDEAVFDRMYPGSFFKQFNRITDFDDDISGQLKASVEKSFTNILSRRKVFVEAVIANSFSRDFPSMGLEWNGSGYVLSLGRKGLPKTNAEKNLFQALTTLTLPFTLEGVEELGRLVRRQQLGLGETELDPGFVRTFNLSTINVNQTVFLKLKDSVRFLNKVVSVALVFPEEISSEILPSRVTIGDTTAVVEIDTIEDIVGMDSGTVYRIKGTPRTQEPFVRGQEPRMNRGPNGE